MNNEVNFSSFKSMNLEKLNDFCRKNNIQTIGGRSNILFEILKFHVKASQNFIFEGCLEILNNSYGFLRDLNNNFIPTPYDIYVHPKFIKDHDLRCGDMVQCKVILPKTEEQKLCTLGEIIAINGEKNLKNRPVFEDFTPTYPKEQLLLANESLEKNYNLTCRMIDLISPVGFGQRTLIVAPPKCGKTTFLHSITSSILLGHKDVKLIIVLVGERPEEVTEMKRIAPNTEIVFSTFDESAENQIKMTEIINERAKRLVEMGHKVVILLDSITRLVRSYNYSVPSSGKILTGGVDPVALVRPKRFFGSARNTEEGGSLTIISTGLVETGSKMDDFIFEELKGTGNAELRLSREISQKRIFPAIEISQSGARRPDLFVESTTLAKMRILETFLSNMDDQAEAAKLLIDRIRTSKTNRELLINMQSM
jgi:transcription termination factor Rho